MKNKIKAAFIIYSLCLLSMPVYADGPLKNSMAFTGLDYNRSLIYTAVDEITRIELEKINQYQLLDKYDMWEWDYARKDSLRRHGCYGKSCLSKLGKKYNVNKMFSGSILVLDKKMVVTLRILDIKSDSFEKVQVNEFLNIPEEAGNMVRITLNDMFGQANDADVVRKLTRKDDFDNAVNNPYQLRLRSDGPRMGFTYFTGEMAEILAAKRYAGGYHAQPLMFQFGYQFEKQYLNEGNFQALFEFVPMLTGLDQGMAIPSLTVMNGLRNNKNGWEFAFGPTVSLVSKAKGYYYDNNKWHLASDTAGLGYKPAFETRADSHGVPDIQAGFVFVFGKTFKSGKLNIPLNIYAVPGTKGFRFGFSFGFNARNRYTYTGQ